MFKQSKLKESQKFRKVKPVKINSIKFHIDLIKEKFQNFLILSNPRYVYHFSEFKESIRPLSKAFRILFPIIIIVIGFAIITARQSTIITPSEMMGNQINLMNMFALMMVINFWGVLQTARKIAIYR